MQTRPHQPALASVGMVMLMVSMSLSSGLLELNRAPWLEADTSSTDVARTYAPFSSSGCLQSNATNYDSGAVQSDGSCVFPLSSSVNGSEFIIGQSFSPIEFGYDPTDPDIHS